MKLTYAPLNLSENRELILRFRADSFTVSFGSPDLLFGSDGKGGERYLVLVEERNRWTGSCVHVFHDGEIIGQIEMRPNDETRTAGYVNLFYLTPEWRNKGVGVQLDAYAQEFFLKHGMRTAYLNVSPSNARAIRFYEKCGWRLVEKIYKAGADVLVMRKELA